MKIITNKEDFNQAKYDSLILVECSCCQRTFNKKKRHIITSQIKQHNNIYCSRECQLIFWRKDRLKILCSNCQKVIYKVPSEANKTKTNRFFCDNSCAATYNNKHKTHGNRRSKLEIYLEKQLIRLYPNLEIHFNQKDAINSELDIYIPSLNLAIELNGIFHYEPIYGADKLSKIKNNDNRKFQACLEKNIELCIIDTSKIKNFKESTSKPILDIIINIINQKMELGVGVEPTG